MYMRMYIDNEVNTDACWALSYISDDNESTNDKIEAAVNAGIVRVFISLLCLIIITDRAIVGLLGLLSSMR